MFATAVLTKIVYHLECSRNWFLIFQVLALLIRKSLFPVSYKLYMYSMYDYICSHLIFFLLFCDPFHQCFELPGDKSWPVYAFVCVFMCVWLHVCVHACVCLHHWYLSLPWNMKHDLISSFLSIFPLVLFLLLIRQWIAWKTHLNILSFKKLSASCSFDLFSRKLSPSPFRAFKDI